MENLWDDSKSPQDHWEQRIYTSRLIGSDPSLVLHGGGNTSYKDKQQNVFGQWREALHIKASGKNLATVTRDDFVPMWIHPFVDIVKNPEISAKDFDQEQFRACFNPRQTPSLEALIHALIPLPYVDHTHADAFLVLGNLPSGEEYLKEIYPDCLFVPYCMPGHPLGRALHLLTEGWGASQWKATKGLILLGHGLVSFGETAKESYQNMAELVGRSLQALAKKNGLPPQWESKQETLSKEELLDLASLRLNLSTQQDSPCILRTDFSSSARHFSNNPKIESWLEEGPLTPDHIVHTKKWPMIWDETPLDQSLTTYEKRYCDYFQQFARPNDEMNPPGPKVIYWKKRGLIAAGRSPLRSQVTLDLARQTAMAFEMASESGGLRPISAKNCFDVEYWHREQNKQQKLADEKFLTGRIALVTGAASGIGKAIAESLIEKGACVVGVDLSEKVLVLNDSPHYVGMIGDITREKDLSACLHLAVTQFGGLDIIVPNAGCFPPSTPIENMEEGMWEKSMTLNLTAHQRLLTLSIPLLKLSPRADVVFIASKNVKAPGKGAAAYSVAKAGMTQLARVATLELAPHGIRVQTLHPNAVFDTGIWTPETLQKRAESYGKSIEEYKSMNLLKTTITSYDVAKVTCSLLGNGFDKTTGLQISIDGGLDRTI